MALDLTRLVLSSVGDIDLVEISKETYAEE